MACCTPGSSPRWQAERPLAPVGAQMNVMYAVRAHQVPTYSRDHHRRVPGPQLAGRANCR
jgi:hypothetical protein